MSVELENVPDGLDGLDGLKGLDGNGRAPDFNFSPRMAALSAGMLGASALAFYIYGHLPGS